MMAMRATKASATMPETVGGGVEVLAILRARDVAAAGDLPHL